jgi:hypothetical protein
MDAATAKQTPAPCGDCGWCRCPLPYLDSQSTGLCAACLDLYFPADDDHEEAPR